MKPPLKIKAVVFDAYGTLFDVYSIQSLAEQCYPGHGASIATLWRDKQIEYTRLITQSDPNPAGGSRFYQPFWDLTRLSLEYTLDRLKLARGADEVERLMSQYARLTPFAENCSVLEQLRTWGLKTAILSNGSPDMLASAVSSAGMQSLLDEVISVDELRLFKTAPESYGLVQKKWPLDKDLSNRNWLRAKTVFFILEKINHTKV